MIQQWQEDQNPDAFVTEWNDRMTSLGRGMKAMLQAQIKTNERLDAIEAALTSISRRLT